MDIRLERMCAGDLPELGAWEATRPNEPCQRFPADSWAAFVPAPATGKRSGTVSHLTGWIATTRKGKLVGYVVGRIVKTEQMPGNRDGYFRGPVEIVALVVHHSMRRRGVGRRLLNAILRSPQGRDLPRPRPGRIYVADRFLDAHLFLRRVGWKATRMIRNGYVDEDETVRDLYCFRFHCKPAVSADHSEAL